MLIVPQAVRAKISEGCGSQSGRHESFSTKGQICFPRKFFAGIVQERLNLQYTYSSRYFQNAAGQSTKRYAVGQSTKLDHANRVVNIDLGCARMARVNGKVVCAGGLLDEERKMKGSVLIMEFENRAGLDQYLATEPYITEPVWEKVKVDPMNVVILNGEKVGK